jgi:5-methylthioadenosine/S-adenosylhomocysteine deaminase
LTAEIGTLPKGDVFVPDGAIAEIGNDLDAKGIEIIDATDMIVMPGFVDSHYHMWSTLGRNFISDYGFEYFPAKWATSALYEAEDFYNSVLLGLAELANSGVTTVHNWSHNNRSPRNMWMPS